MAKDSIRGLAQLAAGVGEMSLAQAKEVAKGLTAASGLDDRLKPKKLSAKVSNLAEEILTAAETNRQHIVNLVRHEVEGAIARADVARLADLEAAKQAVFGLAAQVDELQRALLSAVGAGTHTGSVPKPDGPAADPEPALAVQEVPATMRPPRRAFTAKKVAATKAVKKAGAPVKKAAPATKAVKKAGAPVKKAAPATKAVKKAGAPVKKAVGTTGTKTPQAKAATKKPTTKKPAPTTVAKRSTAKEGSTK